jgi:magnesium-transporting ATPase (P-type)
MLACKGYRTLVFGMREVDLDTTRDSHELMSNDFEKDLTLLGATGVEDLL